MFPHMLYFVYIIVGDKGRNLSHFSDDDKTMVDILIVKPHSFLLSRFFIIDFMF